jgi:hypothetical protein
MGERMGRIEQMETDFFYPNAQILSKKSKKKSVSICPIRSIRSPIRATLFLSGTEHIFIRFF